MGPPATEMPFLFPDLGQLTSDSSPSSEGFSMEGSNFNLDILSNNPPTTQPLSNVDNSKNTGTNNEQQRQRENDYFQSTQPNVNGLDHPTQNESNSTQLPPKSLVSVQLQVSKKEKTLPQQAQSLPHVSLASPNSPPMLSEVDCQLLHKPRRSKGVWQPVVMNDSLRVTKGKGKWLKLETRCRYPFDLSTIAVHVLPPKPVDDLDPSSTGFTIELSKFQRLANSIYYGELEIKLTRVARKLQFQIDIVTPSKVIISALTVPFSAHNNGKASTRFQDYSLNFMPLTLSLKTIKKKTAKKTEETLQN